MTHSILADGAVNLYLEDCLTFLKTQETDSYSSMIADPPYGLTKQEWDSGLPPQEVLTESLRVSRGPVIWFSGAPCKCVFEFGEYKPIPDRMLVWHAPFSLAKVVRNGVYYRFHTVWCWRLPKQQEHHLIPQDVIRCNTSSRDRRFTFAPMKPTELMWRFVRAFGGERVLDTYMGSGTTGIACIQAGVEFTGVDNNKRAYAMAVERCKLAIEQRKLVPNWQERVDAFRKRASRK